MLTPVTQLLSSFYFSFNCHLFIGTDLKPKPALLMVTDI